MEDGLAAAQAVVKDGMERVLAQAATFNQELTRELGETRKQVTRADERVTQTNMEMKSFVAA